ncbi:MAG: hypothetical protein KKF24_00555 [Gammaproteobacteria bacterium]|nr:hypothetical protein [Gammaproteobacteria bacterium]MBU1831164.1 hypothetical protein [Gammaproteobacteria bacterium]
MLADNELAYHEIDFLLPAQRFNIQFSYVSQKGLSFIREFLLRLVHVAPMSRGHIASYFGLSHGEVDEAVSDLVQRGELTLGTDGRLTLTDKSSGYFTNIGEIPQLSAVQNGGVSLSFDLAVFSCLENDNRIEQWKSGLALSVDDKNRSMSEKLVERNFQRQFNQILDDGYLPNLQNHDDKTRPYIYTVNSVNQLRSRPLRLKTNFKVNADGRSVEREDYDVLNNSEIVHELVTAELSKLSGANNTVSIFKAMATLGDEETFKLFDSSTNLINPTYLMDMQTLEANGGLGRTTFIGPIYTGENWGKLQKVLAPILVSRVKKKTDVAEGQFTWIAPSDPFWAKNDRFTSSLSQFIEQGRTNKKIIYSPVVYVPLADESDFRTARQWRNELSNWQKQVKGLVEGFLDGNVEILHLEGELVVVIYHLIQPDIFPVSMPLGFISTNKAAVNKVGKLVFDYVNGVSSFEKVHDCGSIFSILDGQRRRS